MRSRENPIRKTTTGKGANYRPTKSGAGMTKKGVAAYRRANPGSKLKTAVTGKVKPGSKAANRRKSYCARSLGQLKRSSAKTRNDPNSRIRQARRRWKCYMKKTKAKIKKVVKGLKKASKTNAAQAKTLHGVLRKNATRNSNN